MGGWLCAYFVLASSLTKYVLGQKLWWEADIQPSIQFLLTMLKFQLNTMKLGCVVYIFNSILRQICEHVDCCAGVDYVFQRSLTSIHLSRLSFPFFELQKVIFFPFLVRIDQTSGIPVPSRQKFTRSSFPLWRAGLSFDSFHFVFFMFPVLFLQKVPVAS